MAVSVSQFKAEFPEFANADTALVQAKLDHSYARLNAEVWGDYLDLGAKYLTAKLLALSPFARSLQLVSKAGKTIYDDEYLTLKRSVASGYRST